MQTERYIAEINPQFRLQVDEPAPLGTKCIFLTPYGSAVIGHWYAGCEFIAWCPLPKLNEKQKDRLKHLGVEW